MLSPTNATTSSGEVPAGVWPAATAWKRGFLSDGRAVRPAQHRVVDQLMAREHRRRVVALRLQAVGHHRDPSAQRAHARQERRRARQRRRLAALHPRAPALGAVGQPLSRPLLLVGDVADDGLVGVQHHRPGPGGPRPRFGFHVRGRHAIDLDHCRAILGGVAHPADAVRIGGRRLRGRYRRGRRLRRNGGRQRGGRSAARQDEQQQDRGQGASNHPAILCRSGAGARRPHLVDRVLEVLAGTRAQLGVHLEGVAGDAPARRRGARGRRGAGTAPAATPC